MKPIIQWLRQKGIKLVIYLVDSNLILANSAKKCRKSVNLICQVLQTLGFLINWKKVSEVYNVKIFNGSKILLKYFFKYIYLKFELLWCWAFAYLRFGVYLT